MSSAMLKIFAAAALVLAVVLVVVGFRMSRNYAERAQQAQQQVQQQEVQQSLAVVALKPLAAYQPIARDAVALVPVAVSPAAPYRSIDEVVGKVPLVDIDAGAPVTQRYFTEGNVLARIIPPGHQAVSVEVNDVVAVGGFVRPGDVVDVLLYLRGGAGIEQAQSRVLLEAARVLAYEERIIDRPEGIEAGDERQRSRQRTAVLAVPEKDTTKLMLGVSQGELRLALHGQELAPQADGEAVAAATTGATATTAATAADAAQRPADNAIGIAELARIRPPASKAPPRPRVEILRGNAREVVTTH